MLEHQSAFMEALRGGRRMRKCIFDTLEQHHAHDFANSRVGPGLYEDLLSAVRESGAAEAVKEFETRFLPLVNTDPSRDNIDLSEGLTNQDRVPAAIDQRAGRWVGISVVLAVAFLGAVIVGFKSLKITTAEAGRSSIRMMTSQTKPSQTPAPAQAGAGEGSVAPITTAEPVSETMTEAVPAVAPEPELSSGD